MAQNYWNGGSTPTTVRVMVRDTTNGAVSLVIGGQTITGTIATTVNDGVVMLEATGLTPGTTYPYTISSPNGGAAGEHKTQPASGPTTLGVVSCQSDNIFNGAFLRKFGLNCLIHSGDESYNEKIFFPTGAGENKADLLDIDNHYAYKLLQRTTLGKINYTHYLPFVHLIDDHDGIHNDWSDDLDRVNANMNYTVDVDAGEWITIKNHIADALWAYDRGRPDPFTATTDTEPFYTDFISGNCHVICLANCAQSRTPQVIRPEWGQGNDMLAAATMQWAKDALQNSPCKFKLIITPKSVMSVSNVQSDTWVQYDNVTGIGGVTNPTGYADWDTLFIWIQANSASWTVPGGVVWVGGDWHSPGRYGGAGQTIAGETYDFAYFNASPFGRKDARDSDEHGKWLSAPWARSFVSELSGGPMVTNRWLGSENGDTNSFLDNFGLIKTTEDYIEVSLISVKTGEPIPGFTGRVLAGAHALSQPDLKVAL